MKTRADQIFENFKAFHLKHPEVWALFKGLTLKLIKAGHKSYSADAVCHQIRWHYDIEGVANDIKINNNYTANYARLFEVAHPEHAGFFRKRHRKSKHQGERIGFDSKCVEENMDDEMRDELLKLL